MKKFFQFLLANIHVILLTLTSVFLIIGLCIEFVCAENQYIKASLPILAIVVFNVFTLFLFSLMKDESVKCNIAYLISLPILLFTGSILYVFCWKFLDGVLFLAILYIVAYVMFVVTFSLSVEIWEYKEKKQKNNTLMKKQKLTLKQREAYAVWSTQHIFEFPRLGFLLTLIVGMIYIGIAFWLFGHKVTPLLQYSGEYAFGKMCFAHLIFALVIFALSYLTVFIIFFIKELFSKDVIDINFFLMYHYKKR